MSKLIVVFLLIALPLSWTTSAAAAYCNHETIPSEQNHLGHHQNDNDTASSLKDVDNSNDGSTSFHSNCSLTHSICSAIPMTTAIGYFSVPSQLCWFANTLRRWSNLTVEPERPKWPDTA